MFQTAIMKLTSICNLDCDYCYMFNLSDETYKSMPKEMDICTAKQLLQRIKNYLMDNNKKDFLICLHGGEPSLWRYDFFISFFKELADINREGFHIDVSLQTNMFKLPNEKLLQLFRDNHVQFGISIDGPEKYNDQHRVTLNGKGSYLKIMQNIEILFKKGYSDLIGGFLCVANIDIPADEFWEWIKSLPVKKLDILWPIQYNPENPPWSENKEFSYLYKPKYGEWFTQIFKLWWNEDEPDIHIRLFDHVLKFYFSGKTIGYVDFLINDEVNMFVINTDGSVEYPDYLRATNKGSVNTGLNIHSHTVHDLHNNVIFEQLLNLKQVLPHDCNSCFFREICGGGFLPGRAITTGYLISPEKSVLCADQFWFFEQTYQTVFNKVASSFKPGEYRHAIPIFAIT